MQEKKQTKELKIRIVSPSANVIDEQDGEVLIKKAEELLNRNVIKFDYSKNCRSKKSFLSGTKEERAKDIIDSFLDKNIHAIIASQGGDNSNDLLELLDYDLISKNKKPFFGLSDVTVLLNVIALKSKIKTYHGLDFLWGLGKNATEYTEKIINSFLKNGKLKIIKNPNTPEWQVINKGTGEGILLGGCLPSFCLLFGTKYDPLEILNSPFILILEDIGESKSKIKSQLVQIRQQKKFSLCKGIILGSFSFCEQKPKENDISIEELAIEVFKDSSLPIARIPEIGHCVENIIIPIGAKGKIECVDKKVDLRFLEQ
jgi:muramoyltetrapeptide carboxypeptidase LdcA involved in peptidoglycan recycling